MSRMPRAGGRYIKPLKTDGTELTDEVGHGIFTLVLGTTYYYVFGGPDATYQTIHLTGYDAGLVITSVTVQDCDHDVLDVPNHSTVTGEWVPEDPTGSFVGTDGTGWSHTDAIVAALGTGVGGALYQISQTGSFRTRIAVVVGAAGGRLRVSGHGKD